VPLTPAHAAAVVPFSRWKPFLWLSPLVVGSMAPDFAYFAFPPQSLRHVGHSMEGLVLFCIPVGLAVLFAFHRYFKRPIVLLLPQPLRAKLWPHCGRFPFSPWKRTIWICLLIYAGAVTHVAWDGFTHDNGWAVEKYPELTATILTVAAHSVTWYDLLQYASTLLGLALLAWWSWQWYLRAPAGRAPADPNWLRRARPAIVAGMVLFAALVGITCGLHHSIHRPGPFDIREFFAGAFITGVDSFGLALLLFMATVRAQARVPCELTVVATVDEQMATSADVRPRRLEEARDPASYCLLRDLADVSRDREQPK
jgi:hypothetical protein